MYIYIYTHADPHAAFGHLHVHHLLSQPLQSWFRLHPQEAPKGLGETMKKNGFQEGLGFKKLAISGYITFFGGL